MLIHYIQNQYLWKNGFCLSESYKGKVISDIKHSLSVDHSKLDYSKRKNSHKSEYTP